MTRHRKGRSTTPGRVAGPLVAIIAVVLVILVYVAWFRGWIPGFSSSPPSPSDRFASDSSVAAIVAAQTHSNLTVNSSFAAAFDPSAPPLVSAYFGPCSTPLGAGSGLVGARLSVVNLSEPAPPTTGAVLIELYTYNSSVRANSLLNASANVSSASTCVSHVSGQVYVYEASYRGFAWFYFGAHQTGGDVAESVALASYGDWVVLVAAGTGPGVSTAVGFGTPGATVPAGELTELMQGQIDAMF